MHASHISLQVVSSAPCGSSAAVSAIRAANDELAAKAKEHPTRFAAFGALPMTDPPAAAAELIRCVKDLGFIGAMVDNHLSDGTYYDDQRFWTVFETAQELDVPIYIYPSFPSKDMTEKLYAGNYSAAMAFTLGSSAWGWHAEVGMHVIRLWAAGLFEAVPKAKIIVGRVGEMLPYMLDRIVDRTGHLEKEGQKDFKQVWNENLWITTAGFFSLDPMACLLRNTKRDRIMFSVDYPFSPNAKGHEFLEKLKSSGMISQEEFEMITYKNAEVLLKVKALS